MFINEDDVANVNGSKYYAKEDTTLDPRKLNDAFRDAAQKIKYVQDIRFTYSVMEYHLDGMVFPGNSPEETRFIINVPKNCEVVGAHLSARNLDEGKNILAKWLNPADVVSGSAAGAVNGQVFVVDGGVGAPGTAAPVAQPVAMVGGGPQNSFVYVKVDGQEGFTVSESITQQAVTLNAGMNYVLQLEASEAMTIGVNNPASIVLWMRTNRDTTSRWTLPELMDGSDVPYVYSGASDAPGVGDIVTTLNFQTGLALDANQQDTVRCDVVKVSDVDLTTNPAEFQALWAERIPRPPTLIDNGRRPGDSAFFRTNCQWSLYRIDFALVASAQYFCLPVGATFPAELSVYSDGIAEPPAGSNQFYRILTPLIGNQAAGHQYKTVYVKGQVADGTADNHFQIDSSTLYGGTTPVSPLTPSNDLTFVPQITPVPAENVKLAYMYVWYRLTP